MTFLTQKLGQDDAVPELTRDARQQLHQTIQTTQHTFTSECFRSTI